MRPIATLKAVLLGLAVAVPAAAQTPTQTLSGVLTGTTTLSANEVYLIDGEVYVDNGAVLNIPAGTVLKGRQNPTAGTGTASVLVVQRGGMINATGTADAPIIFTAEADDVTDAFDTNESQRGLWGGVVILGNATNNRGERTIEGIDAGPRTTYGPGAGFPVDDEDNSGTLRYVSIRHAGFTLTADAEINGLTLGGVGRGTTLEYVEVFANSDDSFEFFGGTVNGKYLVGAFSGDDDLDWDTGYTGNLQFVFSLKDESGDVGRCIEGDGSASPFTAAPMSSPVVSNLTCVGSGLGSDPGGSDAGGPTFALRDNTGGFIYNSILTQFQTDRGGIDLEPLAENQTDRTTSTEQNFFDGELDIRNNIFFDFSTGTDVSDIVRRDNTALETAIGDRNRFFSPGLINVVDGPGDESASVFDDARDQDGVLDPRPAENANAASGADFSLFGLDDDFFDEVDYLGAFAPAPTPAWIERWTALDQMGYLSPFATPAEVSPSAAFALTVGPNPTAGDATVRFTLDRAQRARLALYDVLGREVSAVEGTFPSGEGSATLATSTLPAGVYVLRFEGESGAVTRQLSVVR
ncbi:T9SS type A sorting domain-containing protein [Rubrivirga sp.]|uniref:T9SS type A sorting domain-containing protein n=1 Tax=Rubrivirga sp. TaxID=1885344 RepID=UPI003B524991